MCKNLKHLIKIIFFVIIYQNLAYSIDIDDGGVTTAKQTFTSADTTITISNSSTLRNSLNNMININGQDNGTVIIEAGSTVETTGGKSNPINGNAASGLTITNSGTIKSASSKAINLTDATTGTTLTNNSGGVIEANTNTISMFGGSTDDVTIHNNGTIFATDDDDDQTNTIKSHEDSTNITINNNSGGHIYHTSQGAVIYLAGGATLNNSGKIENKDGPTVNSIGILGSTGVTLNLKDEGIVIGKINIAGSGHTIKVNHGMGRSYYYNTSGTGTYDLEDLDGNIIVKGSVGSVAQGGNEILDEQLGHKSINLRKSIGKFKRSEQYLNQEDAWTEMFTSFEKRQGEKESLRLEHNNLRAGANIIQPGQNSNQILSIETGRQEFAKDHNIDRISLSAGLLLDEKQTKFNSNSETFFVIGVTLNKSTRRILTNTTTSGFLDIEDEYFNYDAVLGTKFLNDMIPDISYSIGYSFTPNHEESHYYKWEKKDFINASVALSDEYLIFNDDKSKLYFNWLADFREAIMEETQEFRVNNVLAEYQADDDLSREITITAGLDYEFQPLENSLFSVNLDGLYSSQETYGAQAKLYYKSIF